MATFKICVYKHQRRKDGRYPVSIRVCWQRQYAYVKTEFYVTDDQIRKRDFSLKDPFLLSTLHGRIVEYERIKAEHLSAHLHEMTAREVADFYNEQRWDDGGDDVDLFAYARDWVRELNAQGRTARGLTVETVLSHLETFHGAPVFPVRLLSPSFVMAFQDYLSRHMKGSSANVYISTLKTLFRLLVEEYTDDYTGYCPYNFDPFRKLRPLAAKQPARRNLSLAALRRLMEYWRRDDLRGRERLAVDIFMLSFCLMGMNLVDLINAPALREGRVEYCRMKTRKRRKDNAFISVLAPPEIEDMLRRHSGARWGMLLNLSHRFNTHSACAETVSRGLRDVADNLGFDRLTSYYARHTWATLARNECGFSMDDVAACLNHVSAHRVTDLYVAPDWERLDAVNRAVLDLVFYGK